MRVRRARTRAHGSQATTNLGGGFERKKKLFLPLCSQDAKEVKVKESAASSDSSSYSSKHLGSYTTLSARYIASLTSRESMSWCWRPRTASVLEAAQCGVYAAAAVHPARDEIVPFVHRHTSGRRKLRTSAQRETSPQSKIE